MLDVIGAGATATSEIDWHAAWNKSEEATNFKIRLNEIHEEGRKKPPVQATQHSEFATSWTSQLWELTVRANIAYWRNPTYIMSKELLNVAGGLFILGVMVYVLLMVFYPEWVGITGKKALEAERSHLGDQDPSEIGKDHGPASDAIQRMEKLNLPKKD